jgi:hypothetical protein
MVLERQLEPSQMKALAHRLRVKLDAWCVTAASWSVMPKEMTQERIRSPIQPVRHG